MNVFLSWSGSRSHGVARAFHEWLPSVIQELQPWISSESISKGATWLTDIRDALTASNGVGIFFLTKEAVSSEWLLFEAGGIASLGAQRVCTICVDLHPADLKPPLGFFQATKLEEADIRKLVDDLNKQLKRPLTPQVLSKSFERAWPDLQAQLGELAKSAPVAKPTAKEQEPGAGTLAAVLDGLRRIEGRLGNLEQTQRLSAYGRSLNVSEDAISALLRSDQSKDATATPLNMLAGRFVQTDIQHIQPYNALASPTPPPPIAKPQKKDAGPA